MESTCIIRFGKRTYSGINMNGQTGTLLIVGVCAGVLLIGAMRRRVEWLLNFVLRTVLGTLAILLLNAGMKKLGIESGVGVNPITVLTSGLLGFPGVAVLYGVQFYKAL